MEELSGKFNSFIHEDGVLLNLGRNAFRYILLSIPDKIEKLYMPYYTCPVVWHGLAIINEHSIIKGLYFYRINENLEIAEDVELGEHDYIVANNYFGIKDLYIAELSKKYGNHLIIDNAQAFFAPVIQDTYAFYSPRKFFGVPDGGVAYVANDTKLVRYEVQDDSSDRLRHLQLRKDKGAEAGFASYQLNENKLDHLPMMKMSEYTYDVLCGIDYEASKERRRANYKILHDALGEMNELPLPEVDTFACPMVYPFIGKGDNEALRKILRDNRIYTATYWRTIGSAVSTNSFEEFLSHNIIPLPIDQRYEENEMLKIIEIAQKYDECTGKW